MQREATSVRLDPQKSKAPTNYHQLYQQPLSVLDSQSLNTMTTPASNKNIRKPSYRPSLAPGQFGQPPSSVLRGGGGGASVAANRIRTSIVPSRGLSGVFNRNLAAVVGSEPTSINSGFSSNGNTGSSNGGLQMPGSVRKSIIPSGTTTAILPPPSSVRPQLRQSLAPRSSSFGIGMGNNGMIGNGAGTSGAGTNMYSMGAPVIPTTSSLAGSTRDPRPLRDRSYQAQISQEIHEYLVTNNFELEMRHPLTPKTLKAPTQKDFVMLFQWLYRRLDPGYRFTKTIDNEVYFLLKTIRYPYLESINKSQIAAVGGQNWPVFMAMLYWMVQLNLSMEYYDWETENAQSSDEGVLSQILDRYAAKSYRAHLENEHDFSEYQAEAQHEISQFSESVQASVQEAEAEIEQVRKRYNELNKEAESLEALEKKREALESDLVKFTAYIDAMESRKAKWTSIIDRLLIELENSTQELKAVQEEKAALQDQISAQGLTPADIDRMNAEREKLEKALEQLDTRQDEMNKQMNGIELAAQRELEILEELFQHYHSLLYRVDIATVEEFHIYLESPLSDDKLGLRPDQLLDGQQDLKNSVRPALQNKRNEISQRVHHAQDESIRVQEQLDRISEALNEKREQVETLEARLNANNVTYDELYETMNSEAATSNTKIEQLERDLHSMKVASQQGLLQMEQRCHDIAIEYDKVKNAVIASRTKMNNDLNEMITFIVSFKLHVQSGLERYENLVVEEWNSQLQMDNNAETMNINKVGEVGHE